MFPINRAAIDIVWAGRNRNIPETDTLVVVVRIRTGLACGNGQSLPHLFSMQHELHGAIRSELQPSTGPEAGAGLSGIEIQ